MTRALRAALMGLVTVLERGHVVANRFRLEEQLGEGGMGAVWLAHHETLDVPCAVKFIRDEVANDALRARFRQEARAAAKLRSPNVVQILDYGEWGGMPYIAMELLSGESLHDRLDRHGRLPAGQTTDIVRDVCRALAHAQERGIVHRDLKPDNLFIVRDADREITKVLDFGIAKLPLIDGVDAQTQTGALIGTPFFMSPEQAEGNRAIDGRSDLWSLAVITYLCLTGRLPFEETGLGALLKAIMVDPLPVPSKISPELPSAFDDWWAQATARDPDARFQSPGAFMDALDEALWRPSERARARTPFRGSHFQGVDAVLVTPADATPDPAMAETHAPVETATRLMNEAEPPPTPPRRLWALLAVAAVGVAGVAVALLGLPGDRVGPAAGSSAGATTAPPGSATGAATTAAAATAASVTVASATAATDATSSSSAAPLDLPPIPPASPAARAPAVSAAPPPTAVVRPPDDLQPGY